MERVSRRDLGSSWFPHTESIQVALRRAFFLYLKREIYIFYVSWWGRGKIIKISTRVGDARKRERERDEKKENRRPNRVLWLPDYVDWVSRGKETHHTHGFASSKKKPPPTQVNPPTLHLLLGAADSICTWPRFRAPINHENISGFASTFTLCAPPRRFCNWAAATSKRPDGRSKWTF